MNIAVTAPLDRKSWLAALPSGEEDMDYMQAQIDLAEQQLLKAGDPNAVYRILIKADIKREGVSIEKHLAECEKVAVMGATLGMGIAALIRRAKIQAMSMAVLLD
mgnify:CR=1 FL=1